jgi:hypothetical protein
MLVKTPKITLFGTEFILYDPAKPGFVLISEIRGVFSCLSGNTVLDMAYHYLIARIWVPMVLT